MATPDWKFQKSLLKYEGFTSQRRISKRKVCTEPGCAVLCVCVCTALHSWPKRHRTCVYMCAKLPQMSEFASRLRTCNHERNGSETNVCIDKTQTSNKVCCSVRRFATLCLNVIEFTGAKAICPENRDNERYTQVIQAFSHPTVSDEHPCGLSRVRTPLDLSLRSVLNIKQKHATG